MAVCGENVGPFGADFPTMNRGMKPKVSCRDWFCLVVPVYLTITFSVSCRPSGNVLTRRLRPRRGCASCTPEGE